MTTHTAAPPHPDDIEEEGGSFDDSPAVRGGGPHPMGCRGHTADAAVDAMSSPSVDRRCLLTAPSPATEAANAKENRP